MALTPTERAAFIKDMAAAAAAAVWNTPVIRGEGPVEALQELADAKSYARAAADEVLDVAAITAAVVAALPPSTGGLTAEELTAATAAGVRQALGTLDNPPTP